MPKVWNLGNTTIRNPNRLRDGLILFEKEFQGKAHGRIVEAKFSKRLKEEGIIETAGSEADWFGRKWRSAFVKLGFIVNRFPLRLKKIFSDQFLGFDFRDYKITPAGYALINASSQEEINDIFLRQLAFLELNSPTEDKFPPGNMKPFIFLLQVLAMLKKKKEEGLNKFEIAAFLQLFRDQTHSEVVKTVEEILVYRKKRGSILTGKVARKAFDHKILSNKARKGRVAASTLNDYADTTVRYSKMSGLLSSQKGRIYFLASKQPIIDALVAGPIPFCSREVIKYLKEFYNGAPLPIDDPAVARKEIVNLSMLVSQVAQRQAKLPDDLSQETDIKKLNKIRHKLNEAFLLEKEQDFANRQIEKEALDEIRLYLDAIGMGKRVKLPDVYEPATFFEWTVWRAFLAIDHIKSPISETRRFPLDEDLRPRHHAPAGGPDMVFEFDDFILVVEVTLLTTSRQEACEGEPVRRHIADIQIISKKPVYGVFIAPSIDTNTADTFRKGDWYYKEDTKVRVHILPLTTSQFKDIFNLLPDRAVMPTILRDLIFECLSHRDALDAISWKKKINESLMVCLAQKD